MLYHKECDYQRLEVAMDVNFSTYLSGFNGFGGSFNLQVLANDIGLHQEYRKALRSGSLPCNRLRILTIGDKGVGKSSTLKYLCGEVCDPNAELQATEGTDITIGETCEQEPNWKHCNTGVCKSADDPGLCAAWCVCKGIDIMGGVLNSVKDDTLSEDEHGVLIKSPQSRGHNQDRGTTERDVGKAFQRMPVRMTSNSSNACASGCSW
ncbi:uncharacterized protein LOC110989393 [Acanthaster planci]|uniref:Uncharacterized protein LOC110989393 n=1 Tax=Acanthaster planci TaxID=133434 RepID=A0A8B7ZV62_ACAPL|nr:uncharacterized protein LOC110989393 [Acanthaster planci]